ncbi:MAG: succinate CoA transferase [Desulfobacterota bacterium]|nr:succinate CoA transferase [Thermodesulfobacteriota bacterium]
MGSRILSARHRAKIMGAEEAASLINHGDTIGMSGFTGSGYPKAVPSALAARIRTKHARGEDFRINVWTGASTGPELNGALAQANAIGFRLPYQSDPDCRKAINTGMVQYLDLHLGNVAAMARAGCLGKLDWAIIEVVKVLQDGRLVPSTSVGNNQLWLDLAQRVILEVNSWHPEALEGLHDIPTYSDNISCVPPIPISRPGHRIGSPYLTCPAEKIAAVVITNTPDRNTPFSKPDKTSQSIAAHIIDFLQHEIHNGRLPAHLLPLQTGVGNIANAVMAGFADAGFERLSAYTEVIQDSMLELILCGIIRQASATAFSLSPDMAGNMPVIARKIRGSVVLRPQDISNHPEVIRRLRCIAINAMIEADIYGNVNSTCVMGSYMQNGIGGSADFARNASLSFFVSPSTINNGTISCIVPMTPHVDHSDHDVQIIVTEQGIADLRGLAPVQRARRIITACAHPDYRPALHDYLERALRYSYGKHIPQLLDEALMWHRRWMTTGTMMPT